MDAATLSKAMGGNLPLSRYQALLPEMNRAMRAAGVTTQLRAAHWLSQLGHECLGLSALTEFASGEAYNGRLDLGNTQPGDGPRFRGRGAIMVTGRVHYTNLSKWAHGKGLVPTATYFVDNPEMLASDRYYCIGAEWYWTVARPQMNSLCDRDDFLGVTKAINGGTRGFEDRRSRLARCKSLGASILPSGASAGTGGGTVGLNYYKVEPHATLLTSSYTAGRNGKTINCIYRHHMAGNMNLQQCVNLWNTSGTSAHYTVNSTGGIGQAVYDSNTAWATGNTEGNQRGISIEHANITRRVGGSDSNKGSWNISDATIINGARLAAALCLYYKLGRPVYGKNIKDHRDVRQTFCPGHLANGGQYHRKWMNEAQRFYDCLVRKSVNPDGTPKAAGGGSQSGATNTKPTKGDTLSAQAEKRIELILDQLAGPEKDKKGNYKFTGWPQLGNKTIVDSTVEQNKRIAALEKAVAELKGDK